jgi:hypothetical protein
MRVICIALKHYRQRGKQHYFPQKAVHSVLAVTSPPHVVWHWRCESSQRETHAVSRQR